MTTAVYRNESDAIDPGVCTQGSAKGLHLLKIKDGRSTQSTVSFTLKTKDSFVTQPTAPLRATIVLGATQSAGDAGACSSLSFTAAQCRFNSSHTTLTCR